MVNPDINVMDIGTVHGFTKLEASIFVAYS